MISLAMLRIGLTQRQHVTGQERRLQAEWLAESGMQRALAALAHDRDYGGETWSVNARELSYSDGHGTAPPDAGNAAPAALVVINVERPAGAPGRRIVRVQADFPPDVPLRARQSKQRSVELNPEKPGAPS
jgi:hypothetical protein